MRLLARAALLPAVPALRALDGIAQQLDYRAALATGRALGRIWFHALRIRRIEVCGALHATFPRWDDDTISRTACRVFENVAANAVTLIWASGEDLRPEDILEHVRFEGLENWRAVERGGAIVAATHTGNWDLAALASAAIGVPLAVVTGRLAHGGLDSLWRSSRCRWGLRLIEPDCRMRDVLDQAGPGRALAVMIDQRTAAGRGGISMPFLARDAMTSTLAAAASLRLELPVLPMWSRTEPDGTVVVSVGSPLRAPARATSSERIRALTRTLASGLEVWIHRHPDSWLWLHRRWLVPNAIECRVGKG